MPIYEYTCAGCGREFEELVLASDEKVKCPECGSDKTRKLISRCRFKSGGAADSFSGSSGGGSSCSGCSGGDCSSCG